MKEKNIVLIGFMGVGKTTVGKMLAKKLNYRFYDCDELIKQEFSMNICDIFEQYGEGFFREIERKTLKKLSQQKRAVISTGGGAVLNPENIINLKHNGIVILLDAEPTTILRNITKDKGTAYDRPLLKCDNALDVITQTMSKRQPFYNCYDYKINTDTLSVNKVVDKVIGIARTIEIGQEEVRKAVCFI